MKVTAKKIAMPAIYHFSFPEERKEAQWGWHRAAELLEAVNTILVSQGEEEMTAEQIVERFPFVDPHISKEIGFETYNDGFTSIDSDGTVWNTRCNPWLSELVKRDSFLPAKVGLELINAAKRTLRSRLRNALAG